MRLFIIGLMCLLPTFGFAQSDNTQKLADIRVEIDGLAAQIARMKAELQTTGAATTGIADSTPLLLRIDLLEGELRRVTGAVERLQFEVGQVVRDGTNRIDDLKFRLTELEGGNIREIPETPPLGTGTDTATTTETTPGNTQITASTRPRLRDGQPTQVDNSTPRTDPIPPVVNEIPDVTPVTERSSFDAALNAYNSGDHFLAAQQFGAFLVTYPNGPLAGEASFWRGESLAAVGDWNLAARSYLDSFSGAPQGVKASAALYNLGVSLGKLGQVNEACLTLNEVNNRYPGMPANLAQKTAAEQRALGCS